MALDPDLQKMIDEIQEIGRMRDELRRMRHLAPYHQKRYSPSFPFDLLETMIRGILSVVERTIQRGVTVSLNYLGRWRKRQRTRLGNSRRI